MSQPIPFTISVALTFAEGAVPSQVPVLLRVPEGATRLLVTGVALDGARPVTSHFRLFAPDDSVVCECALNSAQTVSVVDLQEAGDHVVLVDHTEGGFVAFALDSPSGDPLRALGTRFERFDLPGSDGGSVDETVQIEFPSTPLGAWAWVMAPGEPFNDPGNAGAGHNVRITLSNAIGDVVRVSMVGYFTYHAAAPGFFGTNDWYAVPLGGEWEFYSDHHAYAPGGHTVTVKADQIRGRAVLWATFYDRTET